MNFYRCSSCNEIWINPFNNKNNMPCCKNELEEVKTNTYVDELDHHSIHVRRIGNFITITIGNEEHPMLDIHYISWVILETNTGIQYKHLNIGAAPIVDFLVAEDEEIQNVYAFCTLHSLWSLN